MVGRASDAARLDAALTAAAGGSSAALLVTGEPGIGKTMLLRRARARAVEAGALVLEVTGGEGRAPEGFAGLADLLRPVLGHLDAIPAAQAEALRGALGLAPARPADRLAPCAAALSLLAAAADARAGPLVALVDDAQWLDAPSVEALGFVARRLGAEGVALLVGAREGAPPLAETWTLPRIELGPLGDDDAAVLLERHAAVPPAPEVRRALIRAAAGNPLALIELGGALDAEQLAGRAPLPRPLPVGPHLARALLRPLEDLPERTRRALVVASADDGSDLLAEALADEGLAMADLEPAERAGVVRIGPTRLAFSHPLVRAAVYESAGEPARRRAHGAFAAAAARRAVPGGVGRRAWHLALASPEPDEATAVALERAADDASRRNAHAAAAEALATAARLSPDPRERGRRLLAGAGAALAAGSFASAAGMLDEVAAADADPAQTLEAMALRAQAEMFGGSVRRAVALLTEAADRIAPADPWTAAALLAQATAPAQLEGDGETLRALAPRAEALAAGAPPAVRAVVDTAVAMARAYAGDPLRLPPGTRRELAAAAATGNPMAHFWAVTAVQEDILGEDYDAALAWLDASVTEARTATRPSLLPTPLFLRADLLRRLGRLGEAHADAAEVADIARETGQALVGAVAEGTLAMVAAVRGEGDACADHAARAAALADVHEAYGVLCYSDAAQGLLALAAGRFAEAVDHLARARARFDRLGAPPPLLTGSDPDLAEARIRAGAVEEGARDIERLAAHPAATTPWPRAAVARCRALLAGDEDDAERHLADALEILRDSPLPLERGRTLLVLGERRRRARRFAAAREPLEEALATFEAMEAAPWAAWARRELRAAGGRAAERDAPAPAALLSPYELRVAMAVAAGATNKEAAAALLISPKTVEYHLGRVYAKLGLRSRADLARRLGDAAGPPGPTDGG